ncbi:MAG: hypothetical protein IKN04_17900 [Clostridia bacterium]|nr:hypothetical protein [Clostridia bacterium]
MPGFNRNYGGASVYVDISDLMDTINMMKIAMSSPAFDEMLRRTFNDAGKKVKSIIRKEVPKEYAVTAAWAGSAVGWPKSQGGAGRIGVVVPINGTRGSIGGRFKASGPRGRPAKGRRAKINAKILKGAASTMPATMDHQGGQPPFMVGGVAFTRKYKGKSHPIVHVVGLGVPQMPINKSEEDVQREIKEVVEKRLVHHFGQLFGK